MKVINRRDLLKYIGLGTASVLSGGCFEKQSLFRKSKRKPNIIYILADDLGYGELGCYGQKQIKTPNIDKLAKEGMRFTQHYAGSTVCAPSRCCLMTGLHTGHCFIRGNKRVDLPSSEITVAEILKQAGYTTGLIGKWGLGREGSEGVPNKQGFDYFYGYLDQRHAHNYYPTFLCRNERRIKLNNVVPNEDLSGGGQASEKNEYTHDLFVEDSLDFIKRNKNNSFFLYLALTIPHANNEAKPIETGMEVPDYGIYEDKAWPVQQKGQAAMITRMDKGVGRIMDLLNVLKIDENTLVIFSSDNGPHQEGGVDTEFFDSSGVLKGFKRDLYEGGIRVPMIARWPGKIKPNSISDHVSAFWDFLPTASELAGVCVPENIDGISYLPTLLGNYNVQEKHKYLYWEFDRYGGRQAVRMGKWKAIRYDVQTEPDSKIKLYDLENDLAEKNDLASKFPGVTQKMNEIMKTARSVSKEFPLF